MVTEAVLFTLGYEGLTPDRYFDTALAAGAEVIVDIRRTPLSRKPGFSKRKLGEAAALRGLEYQHHVDLGTPRDILYAYRETHDTQMFERGYAEYLDEHEDAIARLAELVQQRACCLLCVEADPAHCHRRIAAERVQKLVGRDALRIEHLRAE